MSTIVVEPEPGRLSPQTTLATRSSLHGPMSTDSRGGVMSMSDYRIPTDNPGVPKFRARIGDGQRRDREIGQIVPATPRRDRPRPIGERDAPKPFKNPPPIKHHSLGSKVGLTWLVGSKVPALRIPANRSRPIEDCKFDGDQHWRYKAVRYDRDKVYLTKKNAEVDEILPNSLATNYVRDHSDAAKNPASRPATRKKLADDVIVVGYDKLLEKPIGLTKYQSTELRRTLKWIDPLRSEYRLSNRHLVDRN